jgi:hypothetical protein
MPNKPNGEGEQFWNYQIPYCNVLLVLQKRVAPSIEVAKQFRAPAVASEEARCHLWLHVICYSFLIFQSIWGTRLWEPKGDQLLWPSARQKRGRSRGNGGGGTEPKYS